MRHRLIAALAALSAFAACATPYHEPGWARLGVSAAPLGGDTYRIQAQLNVFSTPARAQDFLLMKAAETAQQQGAVGFVILGSQDTTRTSTMVIPGTATTNAHVYGAGNQAYGTATTTYTPSQAYPMAAPGGVMMIRLVREPIPAGVQYFNAAEILAAVGPRVRQ